MWTGSESVAIKQFQNTTFALNLIQKNYQTSIQISTHQIHNMPKKVNQITNITHTQIIHKLCY